MNIMSRFGFEILRSFAKGGRKAQCLIKNKKISVLQIKTYTLIFISVDTAKQQQSAYVNAVSLAKL